MIFSMNELGAIFILRKGIGVGGPENGNFPLLYVMKTSLRIGWVALNMLCIIASGK